MAQKKTILIVDDHPLMIQKVLSRSGYHAEVANGGHEGIRRFDSGRFDLVITDVKMAGIDGYGVARHIRHSHRSLTPIIGISGTPWLLDGDGFDRGIGKPCEIQTLLDAVEDLIRHAVTTRPGSLTA